MEDSSDRPATACNRRTAARLLLGGSLAGLAASGVASAGDGDDSQTTLAFHCSFGKPVEYSFEASGDVTVLDHAPHLDVPDESVTADRGAEIDGGTATGTVNGGYDVFAYEGDLIAFEITAGDCGHLELWDTGDAVDACVLAKKFSDPGTTPSCDPEVMDSCQTIDEPGYYVLDGDIDGTDHDGSQDDAGREVCIEIAADDVVLDGRGHAIDGGTDGGVGLRVTGDDAVVQELEVINWERCVELRGDRTVFERATIDNGDRSVEDREVGLEATGTACTVRDVEVLAGDTGMRLASATDALLADCAVTGLTYGIVLDGASGCVLRNSTGGTSGGEGLLMGDSHDNVVAGNEFGAPSICAFVGDSHRNVFRENSFSSSPDHALAISNCEELALLDNDASGGHSGISLQDVSDSVLRGNAASETDRTGIRLVGGSNNVLAQNVTERNEEAGIELLDAAENVLSENTVRENSGRAQEGGIHLVDAVRNAVVGNTVCDNAGPSQIVVAGSSSGNQLSNNDTTC